MRRPMNRASEWVDPKESLAVRIFEPIKRDCDAPPEIPFLRPPSIFIVLEHPGTHHALLLDGDL